MSRRGLLGAATAGVTASLTSAGLAAPAWADYTQGGVPEGQREARRGPAGVDNPDLLPKGPKVTVIDLERMMTSGEVTKMDTKLKKLEADTGYKVRVLTQRYPNTPGLAIKDYWGVDDKTIVLIVDKGERSTSNMLNFNVGEAIELDLPPIFFTRVRNFFGISKFRKDRGDDIAVQGAVDSIVSCLRQDGFCTDVPAELKEFGKKGDFFN